MVQELTKDNFDATIQGDKPIIIDFWAPWCGPCRMMAPVFEELGAEYDNAVFAKLNVDDHAELAGKYGVQSIPTLVVVKKGEEVGRLMGFMPKEALKEKIDALISA
jgi:thioredoxin 1